MLAKLRNRLTFANVVSVIALFVALGGSSVAAVSLKRNAVKNRHIAKNAVTAPKVKNASLLSEDFAPGQLPAGPQGERGQDGQNGAPGSAVAYARVNADGTLDATRSKNIDSASKRMGAGGPLTGSYCIDPSVPVNHVVAVIDWNAAGGELEAALITGGGLGGCPPGPQWGLVSTHDSAGGLADRAFWVLFN
jgi:hypothetical protein